MLGYIVICGVSVAMFCYNRTISMQAAHDGV